MSKLRSTTRASVYMAVLAAVSFNQVSAAETVGAALKESDLLLNLRLRYEGVDQVGFAEDADPLTARLRVGVKTGEWGNTALLAEAVGVELLSGDYNSTINGDTMFPVVADPGDIFTVNRFAFTNKSLENTVLSLGRQRIILDDSRFIGNVGWRQFEQTYDGLRAVIGGGDKVKVDLSYISQVNRIFGPDSPGGKFNGDIILANVSKSLGFGKLTGFLYSVDLDEAAGLSTNTLGFRLTGSRAFNDMITGIYTLSAAQQTDAGNNTADLSEMYLKAEGGAKFGKTTVALGVEQLGSDGVNSVTMPLATLHAFQGWADKLLATPAAGVNDTYVRLAYAPGNVGPFTKLSMAAFYHEFDANVGSAHFGDEFNFIINARTDRASYTLKYASYDADQLATDTDKLWLMMDYSF